jgi:hypothetical protein
MLVFILIVVIDRIATLFTPAAIPVGGKRMATSANDLFGFKRHGDLS